MNIITRHFRKDWQKNLVVIVFLGVVIALAFIPLFRGRIIYEEDIIFNFIPLFKSYSDRLSSGESFQIQPHIYSGFPILLSQNGKFDEPVTFLLSRTFSFLTAYNLRIFLDFWFASVFTFLFVRELKLNRTASLLSALAFVTSQVSYGGMKISYSNAIFLMPGIFYVTKKLHDVSLLSFKHALPQVLLGVVIVGMSFISAHAQLNLYSSVAFGFWVVYLLWQHFSWRFLTAVSSIFLTGSLFFLPQLLRVLEFMPLTHRAGGISWSMATGGGSAGDSLGSFMNSMPRFLWPDYGPLSGLYIGSISVLFFVFALRNFRKEKKIKFFVGLLVFSLLSSFPYPLFWMMHKLPIFKLFRAPHLWLLVVSFAMSVLAGLGYQVFIKGFTNSRKRSSKFLVPVLTVVLAMNFVIPVWFLANKNNSVRAEVLLRTPWVVKEIYKREQAHELFRVYNFFSGEQQWHLFAKKANPSFETMARFQREFTQPISLPAFYNISTIKGGDPFVPRRYDRVLAFLEWGRVWGDVLEPTVGKISDFIIKVPGHHIKILGMMNVKYMWTIVKLPKELLEKNRVAIVDKKLLWPDGLPIILYENLEFINRIYSPAKAVLLKESENNFSRIIEEENDYKKVGFIECNDCEGGEEVNPTPPKVQIGETHDDSIKFRTEGPEDSWVIISNSFIPRWHAYVDGKETKIYYANYIYQGIKVPKGEHEVVIKYEP